MREENMNKKADKMENLTITDARMAEKKEKSRGKKEKEKKGRVQKLGMKRVNERTEYQERTGQKNGCKDN